MPIKEKIQPLFIGMFLCCILFHPIQEIPDTIHHSSLFACIVLSVLTGICTIFLYYRKVIYLHCIDLLVWGIFISSIWFYPPNTHLFGLARFALIIVYYSIRQSENTNNISIYYCILITIVILSVTGYLQLFDILPSYHPVFTLTGPYANPNIYAGVLSLLLSIPLTVLLSYPIQNKLSARLRAVTASICFIAFPLIVLSNCRASWIAILAVVGYMIYHRYTFTIRWRIITITLIILSIYGFYQLKPDSANGRILIWKVTARMIQDKPLTGFTPSGLIANYMHYQADYLKETSNIQEKWLADNNHSIYNEPLRWTATYGIAGLLVYLCIVYLILLYRPRDICSLAAKMMCISSLAWGLFSYPEQTYPIQLLTIIALAKMSNKQSKILLQIPSALSKCSRVFILFTIIWMGAKGVIMYQNHKELFNLSQNAIKLPVQQLLARLSRLETTMKKETVFWPYYCYTLDRLRQDSLLLSKIGNWERLYPSTHTYILKGDVLFRTGKLQEAENAYRIASNMVPSHQKARYKLVLLYHRQGRIYEAKQIAQEILSEKIKNYSFETYEIHRELQKILEIQIN